MSNNQRHNHWTHRTSPSIDTHASGIADSTISFAGLEAFPPVPDSLPGTPTRSDFGRASPASSNKPPLPSSLSRQLPPQSTASSDTSIRQQHPPTSYASRNPSPFDWHEGASSIDVDATEDRMLPTSFITGLLQENGANRTDHRGSYARSDISEMTYPPAYRYDPNPVERRPLPLQPIPTTSRPPRPMGARAPPSAFAPIPESIGHTSDNDSETLASTHDNHIPATIRPASRAVFQAVGVAQATLHNVTRNSHDALSHPDSRYSTFRVPDNRASTSQSPNYPPSSPPFTPPSASATHQQPFLRSNIRSATNPDSRQSTHSAKSFVPSFISRISSSTRHMLGLRKKPLPPVPMLPHIPIATEARHRRDDEDAPLPDLMARAGTLNVMLEKGYHPHHSINTYFPGTEDKYEGMSSGYEDSDREGDWPRRATPVGPASPQTWVAPGLPLPAPAPKILLNAPPKKSNLPSKKRLYIICGTFILVALGAIGAGVGVSLAKKGASHTALPNCDNGLTGQACNLNATCLCTSTVAGRCDNLASNLVELTDTMNAQFSTNYTTNGVFASIWAAQGSPNTNKCVSQSLLVDVAPGLILGTSPNRTKWAQAAIMWNLVQSQDVDAVAELQSFVIRAPWSQLSQEDGPVEDNSPSFTTTVSGFLFNFAAQNVKQPPVSFVSSGQPSGTQISRVGDTSRNALDRMYGFALASSSQRQTSLATYWTSVLQQRPADLNSFLAAVASSPILLPYDASFSKDSSVIKDSYSTTSSFPPPIACYPSLKTAQQDAINAVQTSVFGLPSIAPQSKLDPSCFGGQPTYGVLNILRLRLPFLDSRTTAPKQAVILSRDAVSRVVVRNTALLSSLPGGSNSPTVTVAQKDGRQYGTLNNMNHVLLNYFNSFTDRNLAMAVVRYVLDAVSNPVPPANSTFLGAALSSIPTLEIAVFGSILPDDTSGVVSSFNDPAGNLFFGSPDSVALRKWAIDDAGRSVTWSDGAQAPLVARDASTSDTKFRDIFSVAQRAVAQNENVPIVQITNSLQLNGKLSST